MLHNLTVYRKTKDVNGMLWRSLWRDKGKVIPNICILPIYTIKQVLENCPEGKKSPFISVIIMNWDVIPSI